MNLEKIKIKKNHLWNDNRISSKFNWTEWPKIKYFVTKRRLTIYLVEKSRKSIRSSQTQWFHILNRFIVNEKKISAYFLWCYSYYLWKVLIFNIVIGSTAIFSHTHTPFGIIVHGISLMLAKCVYLGLFDKHIDQFLYVVW